MANKHAYLIMSHNDFNILEKNILLIDDVRNDIYIHIDKKVKNFNFNYYKNLARKSKVYFVKRIDTRWGDFSLVEAEIMLIKSAIKNKYKYYHLISGSDLTIKTQDEIHEFFYKNNDLEYIHFNTEERTQEVQERVQYYYLMKYYRCENKIIRYIGIKINSLSLKIQKLIKLKRKWEKNIELKYGSQWFSITNDLAKYIVSKEKWIEKYFKYTSCSDELFLQTLVYNSRFREKLYSQKMDNDYKASLRYIDWNKKGEYLYSPYVLKKEDFFKLIKSDRFFARKFSTNVDSQIIERIFEYLYNK